MVIVIDNGFEFHSDQFDDACNLSGVTIHPTANSRPYLKGIIEKIHRQLNGKRFHGIPTTPIVGNNLEGDSKWE
jgi:putative transposase